MRILLVLCSLLILGCISATQEQPAEENVSVANLTEQNETNETECVCTLEYAPVCGVDGKTYGNRCNADCAGIAVASQGECEPEPEAEEVYCTDSDGDDIYTKGTVTAYKNTFEDTCQDMKVKEYTCEGNEAHALLFECPSGYICNVGRCAIGKAKCSDTDGGYDIYLAGKVEIDSPLVGKYLDKCTSDKMLREYYCQDDELVIKDVECETECMQGRCLK